MHTYTNQFPKSHIHLLRWKTKEAYKLIGVCVKLSGKNIKKEEASGHGAKVDPGNKGFDEGTLAGESASHTYILNVCQYVLGKKKGEPNGNQDKRAEDIIIAQAEGRENMRSLR